MQCPEQQGWAAHPNPLYLPVRTLASSCLIRMKMASCYSKRGDVDGAGSEFQINKVRPSKVDIIIIAVL